LTRCSCKGIFRTLLVKEGKIPSLDAHLRRLDFESCLIGLPPPKLSCTELLKKWKGRSGRLRISVTKEGVHQELFSYHPPTLLRMSVVLKNTPYFRVKEIDFSPRLALQERAKKMGVDEVIEVDAQGYLLESTYSNLIWKEGDVWCTPNPKTLPIYYGVTVEEFSKREPVQFVERRVEELPKKSILYSCNALREMVKVKLYSHPAGCPG
jgi:branched-subunit amino acid aminotransferase/4-amino-4-deoxychorismate lyase